MTRLADALHAVEHGASAVGFIFYTRSPRSVTPDAAAQIAAMLPANVLRVGVFVNEFPDYMLRVADQVPLDVIQLHGDEDPGIAAALAGRRVWKAVRVDEDFQAGCLDPYCEHVEAFLLDTAPRDAQQYGGTGETFSWQIAAALTAENRIILAGGLDGSNVAEAIAAAKPWGVDASSRLESQPGVKDPAKVAAYLAAVQSEKQSQ